MRNQPVQQLIVTFSTLAFVVLLAGCGHKESTEPKANTEPYELVNAGNSLLYRINKTSGAVSLIVGAQMTKLDEPITGRKEDPKQSRLIVWPEKTLGSLGDLKLELMTKWREGKMFYIFRVSPYAGRVEAELTNTMSSAVFHLNFNDSDGFELSTLPIKLSEMIRTIDDKGKPSAMSINGNITLSLETYEAIKGWSAGRAGFSP